VLACRELAELVEGVPVEVEEVRLRITRSKRCRHWRNMKIAKMLLTWRDVHDRRDLGDNDVASEVEAGGLEHPLSTQVVGNDAVSAAPLLEEAGSLLIPSLLLPHLLAFFLTAKSSPAPRLNGLTARGLRGLRNIRTPRSRCERQMNVMKREPRNRRQRPTIGKIMRKPDGTNSRA